MNVSDHSWADLQGKRATGAKRNAKYIVQRKCVRKLSATAQACAGREAVIVQETSSMKERPPSYIGTNHERAF